MANVVLDSPSTDLQEAESFTKYSSDWWDDKGRFKGLFKYNMAVFPFFINEIKNAGLAKPEFIQSPKPFEGLEILEVGCGGGIIGEAMSKTGCSYVGIDINGALIKVAKNHLSLDPTIKNVRYHLTSVEEHVLQHPGKYDVVIVNNIIPYVNNVELFLKCCTDCLKRGGSIFVSSLNKTWLGWFIGIVVAETVGTIQQGCHKWNKLMNISNVDRFLNNYQCRTVTTKGVMFSLFSDEWYMIDSHSPFYVIHASKNI